jgi:tetratricopeptide (TPR) repeat protein
VRRSRPGPGQHLVLAIAAGLALALVVNPAPAVARHASTADLFDRYIKNPAGTVPELATIDDIENTRSDLVKLMPKYLSAPLPARSANAPAPSPNPTAPVVPILEQRRRNVVAFALDVAGANALRQSYSAERLSEWACYFVRRRVPPSDFDHRWQLAMLALIEGVIDPDGLREQLSHFESQFPGDPRAEIGRALADEQATAPIEFVAMNDQAAATFAHTRNPTGASKDALMERAVKSFEALLKDETLRPEASLRLAHLQIALGHDDQALASLDMVNASSGDAYTLYLSRLFRGQALEHLGRAAAAQDAYRSALELSPQAHAATMALATSLFRSGKRSEADQLVSALVKHDDPSHDVWWSYYAGDFHLWGQLIGRVREMVK